MFKKFIYGLVILTMLFAAFGVQGIGGVQKAAAGAFSPIDSLFTDVAGLNFHGWLADFTTLGWQIGDPATTCIGDPSADTGWETVTTAASAQFLHVHSLTAFDATIAVFADNSGLGAELGCQNSGAINAFGLHNADLVVPVTGGTKYHVYIIPRQFATDPIAGGDDADLWIGQFRYGHGIIVNLCEKLIAGAINRCDAFMEPMIGATVQAQLSTGGPIYAGIVTPWSPGAGLGTWTSVMGPIGGSGDLFVDVPDAPAGASYTLGISSLHDLATQDTIWFVPNVPGSGAFLALDPNESLSYFDSLAVNHRFQTVGGGNLAANVFVAMAGGVLPNMQLPLGSSDANNLAGSFGEGFRIIPGGAYDFEAVRSDPGDDYYLVSLNVDCLNVLAKCPLAFDATDGGAGALAHSHTVIDRRANVPSMIGRDIAIGVPGTNFAYGAYFGWVEHNHIILSAGVPLYMDAMSDDVNGDTWLMQVSGGGLPATLVPNTNATHTDWWLLRDVYSAAQPAGDLHGELFTTLTSTGLPNAPDTTEVPYTAAATSLHATYTPYVDSAGNILIPVSPLDFGHPLYYPLYAADGSMPHRVTLSGDQYGNIDPYIFSGAILGTHLVNTPAYGAGTADITGMIIGRYAFQRCINVDGNSDVNPQCPGILYAISPVDNRMGDAWSWSWVEGLYEMGLTTGTAPGVYSPQLTITRAEMAVFLSRLMSLSSTVPAAPAAVGTVYTDVPATQWAAKYIEQMHAYDIAGDCDPVLTGNQYCPNAPVTRAEMAKFVEKTYRTAVAHVFDTPFYYRIYAFGNTWWDSSLNVITPGVIYVDVPAENWASWWIDEMAVDGLTAGCRTEMSGLAFIHYYCPDGLVTRAEMAKFIVSAYATQFDIQFPWPFLSPSK